MTGTDKSSLIIGLVVSALLLLAGSSAWADDVPDPEQGMAAEPATEPPTGESRAEARGLIEEIIVTSRKREENILEIPESVTAFSETTIERSNITGLSDISLLAPNLYMGTRTDGFPNVSIRGLGAFGNTQGVGFYLDDVQLFGDASARFGDFERIEVLKGPQGILYGGTNIGGAVKFVLQRPDPDEFSGRVKLRAGEDSYYDAEFMVNVPLTPLGESWAARLFYYSESDDSFLDNPNSVRLNGERNSSDRDPRKMRRSGVRSSVAGDITERLSLYASLRYNDRRGPNDFWARETSGRLKYNDKLDTSFNPDHDRETWGWSVELGYDFDDFRVLSITSNSDTDSDRESDLDIQQEYSLDLFRPHRIDVFAQELRFTSTGAGPLQWQFGGFYQEYDRDLNSDLFVWGGSSVLFADPAFIPDPLIEKDRGFDFLDPLNRDPTKETFNPDADPPGFELGFTESLVFERSKRERESIAFYGSASYRWNDWEFGAGYRSDRWESKRANADSGIDGTQRDTENLFRGSVAYFLDDDRSMVYALYSQGFEPGDFNLTSLEGQKGLFGYGREKATNYELGYKGRLLDDRVVLTAALFKLDYKDRQIELQTRDPANDTVVELILNVGDSRHWGYEVDVQAFLHPDWTLSASYGYTDAEWKSGTHSPVTGISISGRTPVNAADWSARRRTGLQPRGQRRHAPVWPAAGAVEGRRQDELSVLQWGTWMRSSRRTVSSRRLPDMGERWLRGR